MTTLDQDFLQGELKKKHICRFCLSQDFSKISSIYMRDTRIKCSAPLPIQIMAIASIEVFSNDGMPSFICSDCTNMFEYSYQFKQMCKKADNLLRQYPLTGVWPSRLDKPVVPTAPVPVKIIKTPQARMHYVKTPTSKESLSMPQKILNSSINCKKVDALTPDISPRTGKDTTIITKIENIDSDFSITFLEKIENNEELSIADIQQLIAAEDVNESEEVDMRNLTVVESVNKSKPKLLNKSSMRILNKDAELGNEPRLSLPKVKQDADGKTEIIAEILNEDDMYEAEPDPKNAALIETNVYPCNECERTFPLLQLRDLHMKNHSRDRKFQCEYCEKSFFSKYDLHRHSFIHNGEKPYKCSVCEKAFSRSSLLTRHEKTHIDVPKFICVHCERPFISEDDLNKHAEKHKINRPFVCKICFKGFAFKQGLERHEIIHSKQQPFSCQYCSESFSTTTKLARHLTAHAGQRPYPCKFCRKSYLLSHHLSRHLRSHKNAEDPSSFISFTCMQCNQSFDTREKLIQHSSSHANEMNLSCPLCKDNFATMIELVSHIEKHSSGELFACEFCDLIFMSADKLQSHTDSDHIHEMEAYHADDRAQADKQKDKQSGMDTTDEKLQHSVNEFLEGEEFLEENNLQNLKPTVKKEKRSPEIINQIIIQSGVDKQKNEDAKKEGDSLLIPLKQRKLNLSGKKETTQSENAKQSLQPRRKTPNASGTPVSIRDPNQPSIQSMLKLPKDVTITKTTGKQSVKTPPTKTQPAKTPSTKTPPTKTPPTRISQNVTSPSKVTQSQKIIKAEALPSPKLIKVEKDLLKELSPSTSVDDVIKSQAGKRKGKIQKITVTKAQAAAMAKEGRIKIKDGKIIMKK